MKDLPARLRADRIRHFVGAGDTLPEFKISCVPALAFLHLPGLIQQQGLEENLPVLKERQQLSGIHERGQMVIGLGDEPLGRRIFKQDPGVIRVPGDECPPAGHRNNLLLLQAVMDHNHSPYGIVFKIQALRKHHPGQRFGRLPVRNAPDKFLVQNRIVPACLSVSERFHGKCFRARPVRLIRIRIHVPVPHHIGVHCGAAFLGYALRTQFKILPDLKGQDLPPRLRHRLNIVFIEADDTEILLHSLLIPGEAAAVARLPLHEHADDRLQDPVERPFLISFRQDAQKRRRKILFICRQIGRAQGKGFREQILPDRKQQRLHGAVAQLGNEGVILPEVPEDLRIEKRAPDPGLIHLLGRFPAAPRVMPDIRVAEQKKLQQEIAAPAAVETAPDPHSGILRFSGVSRNQ